MKKLDVMNSIEPGRWAIVNGKVQRIEEFVPEPLVVEKEEKEELKEKLEEVEEQDETKPELKSKKTKKKGGKK